MDRNDNPSETTVIKRNVNDSVFRKLFSDTRYLAEFYRDIHPDEAPEPSDFEILSTESVFISGMKSDLTFTIHDHIYVLVEAQTTWNPNMASRCLFYMIQLLTTYLNRIGGYTELDKAHKIEFPLTELYVVYCGDKVESIPDEIRFSDVYKIKPQGNNYLECTTKVLHRSNADGTMKSYIDFAQKFRENLKQGKTREQAIKDTIEWCIQNGVFPDFFRLYFKEITKMLYTEAQLEEIAQSYYEDKKAEGLAEGKAEGKAEGILETKVSIAKTLLSKGYSLEQVKEIIPLTEEEIALILK